jgi:hypothetical protein
MIRIVALLPVAFLVTLFLFSGGDSVRPASALLPPVPCHAKIGVMQNRGAHPFAWPHAKVMDFTPQPINQDGSRDFTFGPSVPDTVIPIQGSITPAGDVTGTGAGTYSGFQTSVSYSGNITYYDMNHSFPRRIIGDYTVGGGGELPGGKTIIIRSDCWFDPPQELADPDGDGKTAVRHDTLQFGSASAGRAAGTLQGIAYKDAQGNVQQIQIADADEVTTSDAKQGPFETSARRKYYDTWGLFGGSIAPNVDADPEPESYFNATLWPEIGSPAITSAMSGTISGEFRLGYRDLGANVAGLTASGGASAVSVVSFDFRFHANALSQFNFLGVSSGDWSWRIDPARGITVTNLNLVTGQASLQVPVLLDAENLRGIYPGTPTGAQGANGLPGEPLRFTENVNITFPPLGLITSAMDNCPDVANADQSDSDADGVGDACEGAFWMDADCDARFGSEDALATLSRRAGVPFDRPSACDDFGTSIGQLIIGDWDCNGEQDAGDVIVALLAAADLPPPVDLPQGCPGAGEFVPIVVG